MLAQIRDYIWSSETFYTRVNLKIIKIENMLIDAIASRATGPSKFL